MNWYGAIFRGLVTGVLWGLVKKTWAGKYIFIGVLVLCLALMFVSPESLQYTGTEVAESIIQLVGFLVGSEAGSQAYEEWFG